MRWKTILGILVLTLDISLAFHAWVITGHPILVIEVALFAVVIFLDIGLLKGWFFASILRGIFATIVVAGLLLVLAHFGMTLAPKLNYVFEMWLRLFGELSAVGVMALCIKERRQRIAH